MTYADHLIYGEFNDASIATIDASPEGDEDNKVWKMHDGSIQTFWKDSSDSGANARLKYTFQFPIIFEKLMIVKPPNIQKLR